MTGFHRILVGAVALLMGWGAYAQAPGTTAATSAATAAITPTTTPVTTPAVTLAAFLVPPDSSIPAGPQGVAIKEGKRLLTETKLRLPDHVGNGLHCTSCHLNAGTTAGAAPLVGLWGVFPEYRSRPGKLISLAERINDCFERSMNGKPLHYASDEMINILAYVQWLSIGVPTGQSVKGRGFGAIDAQLKPDAKHGSQVFADKCASCHAANGLGLKNPTGGYVFPPLWGDDSFNDGAGMARTFTAAAFVKYNMPLGLGGTLTDQQAIDVAEFFTHQPRPVYAGKELDWSKGGKPKDARN